MQRDDFSEETDAEPDFLPASGVASEATDARGEFDAFYAATARRMVAVVYALNGNFADAEDAVHEAYARAWARWGRLVAGGDPAAWVRVVASAWRSVPGARRAIV